jgi:ribonuclease P protein component
MRFFLRKNNRLTHEKDISKLFSSGSSIFVYPVKLLYTFSEIGQDNSTFKIMVVVSKRNLKRAVKRNLIKRRLREIFRLNLYRFVDNIPSNKRLDIALIYVSKEIQESSILEKAELELIDKLKLKLNSK